MTCHTCKREFGEIAGYVVSHLDNHYTFCGRICLTEWAAPEIKKSVVVRQWVPTPEEEARMTQ